MRLLLNLARIRRIEFLIVELTIFFIPIFVSIRDMEEVTSWVVAEGFLLFFVLYALGDGINCLADRELDKTYKTHLSRAVYELGVPVVVALTVAEAVIALALATHLSLTTGKWFIVPLVVFGMFLGIGYSVKPIHFKARGMWHLVCLWLLLYFVPMAYASLLVRDALDWRIAVLAASYATVEMGVILVNTAEDYPEDRDAGIRTTIVALGLANGIAVAAWMVLVGSISFVGTFVVLFAQREVAGIAWLAIALLAVVCGRVTWVLWGLRGDVERRDVAAGALSVKASAKRVPLWATAIGWCGVLCSLSIALAQ